MSQAIPTPRDPPAGRHFPCPDFTGSAGPPLRIKVFCSLRPIVLKPWNDLEFSLMHQFLGPTSQFLLQQRLE